MPRIGYSESHDIESILGERAELGQFPPRAGMVEDLLVSDLPPADTLQNMVESQDTD